MELKGKFFIKGKIEVKTGLHVGGSRETLDIGGVDNPVIRTGTKGDKIYIPGSSLKGKIRSLLEKKKGTVDGNPCACGTCEICKIFGPYKPDNIKEPEPVRIIVRDSCIEGDNVKTEIKYENTIDRVTGKASNPRPTERVPEGESFKFETIFNVYTERDIVLIKKFVEGMKLLEDDYLGGSGSRGYGQVEFKDMVLKYRPKEYYEGEDNAEKLKKDITDVSNLKELIKDKNKVEEIFSQ